MSTHWFFVIVAIELGIIALCAIVSAARGH
jgi:hypothetical protein